MTHRTNDFTNKIRAIDCKTLNLRLHPDRLRNLRHIAADKNISVPRLVELELEKLGFFENNKKNEIQN